MGKINRKKRKKFTDIRPGDIVICYDEYSHDYVEHAVQITSMEDDPEYSTDTNIRGRVYWGDDLDEEYFGDDYITVVTESNFVRIHEGRYYPRKIENDVIA